MGTSGNPRRLIRETLETALPESDFDAFCLDFFPEVARQFSGSMCRNRRITMLIERHEPLQIAAFLRQAHPDVELPDVFELPAEPAPAELLTPRRLPSRRVSRERPVARPLNTRPVLPPQAAPLQRSEKLYSNLLPVERFSAKLFSAPTELSSRREIAHKMMDRQPFVPNDWLLHERRLWSFRDLSESPWSLACDAGGMETFDASEWSENDDPDVRRLFVQLMGRTLDEMLRPVIGYHREGQCYYFRPRRRDDGLEVPMHCTLEGGARKSRRTVVKLCPGDENHPERRVYQHTAFEGRFLKIEEQWYLAIHPTYLYTTDGKNIYLRQGAMLSGLKRKQRNMHVYYELRLWAEQLRSRSRDTLFKKQPIVFGEAIELRCPVGVDDEQWLQREPPESKEQLLLPGVSLSGEPHDLAS